MKIEIPTHCSECPFVGGKKTITERGPETEEIEDCIIEAINKYNWQDDYEGTMKAFEAYLPDIVMKAIDSFSGGRLHEHITKKIIDGKQITCCLNELCKHNVGTKCMRPIVYITEGKHCNVYQSNDYVLEYKEE